MYSIDLIVILLGTLLLDIIDGEVRDKVCPIHPVRICWIVGSKLLSRMKKNFINGVLLWIFVEILLISIYCIIPLIIFVRYYDITIVRFLCIVVLICFNKYTISLRLLFWYYREILRRLRCGERGVARVLLQEIVRRDVFSLDDYHVNSALIETFVESLVDGFSSTVFWYVILGPVGSYLQRIANTLDSLVGYRYEPYREIGKFSAIVDTILNIPGSVLLSICLVISNFSLDTFRRFVKYFRNSNVSSINARLVFSAISSVLNVRLEKISEYSVGEGNLPSIEDCERCYYVCIRGLILYFLAILTICYFSIQSLAVPFLVLLGRMVL